VPSNVGIAAFAGDRRVTYRHTLEWAATFLLKIAPSHDGIWTQSNRLRGSLGPPESNPNFISIGSAVFAGLTSVTHRRPYSVGKNRPHLRT